MHISKFIGSTMIVIGTSVGAGMLALPMISAAAGFSLAAFLTIFLWALMTLTALLLLEVSLAFPVYKNSLGTMARATFGRSGKIVTWISCLILLYALAAAYIAGNTSLLTNLIVTYCGWHMPSWINAVVFTIVLGGVVFWSTRAVDGLNRFLLSIKGFLLIIVLFLLMPHVHFSTLFNDHSAMYYILSAAPIFLCSFGFHTVIPSLVNYNGMQVKSLRLMIIFGTTITVIVYLLWLVVTFGVVPLTGDDNSFAALMHSHGSVGEFVATIARLIKNPWITAGIDGFANIAMTTSFLGVSLSLFDFLADGFGRRNNVSGRLQTALLTFIPPLVFAVFYPQGFILALGYASIFVAILTVILPVLMVYKIRHGEQLVSPYHVKVNNFVLFIIGAIGVILIILQILADLNLLPVFVG